MRPTVHRIARLPILALTAALATACGTNSIQTAATTNTQGLTAANTSGDTSGTTTTSSSSGSTSVVVNAGTPPISLRVGTYGYNPVSVSVSTKSVLMMTFQAGVQDQTTQGTNFEPQYSMLGVYITVGSTTQPTQMSSNGYGGGTATVSAILNFSSAIPAGSSSVNIVVAQPNYDFDCLNYDLYCAPVPWMHVVDTHPWHGTLTIQTDDTEPLSETTSAI